MKRLNIVIVMAFASLAVLSPVLGTKVVNLGGIKFTAGLFTMLLAYSLLNVVNELWGKAEAQFLAATIVLIRVVLFVGVVPLLVRWPAYLEPAGYAGVLGLSLRTFIGSEVGTLVQNLLIDIPLFQALKKRLRRGFFFRANVANIVAWTFGTASFVLVSYGSASKSVWPIFLGQTVVKVPLSFLYSWLGWAIVRRARGRGNASPAPAGAGLTAETSADV